MAKIIWDLKKLFSKECLQMQYLSAWNVFKMMIWKVLLPYH